MLRIKKIDHVAVCVADIDEAQKKYKALFGLETKEREVVASQRTEAALLPIGESNLELISPKGNEGLERFLEKRGPGLHHIAVEVEGIEEALAFLKALGVPLIDEAPRKGARGHKVAFVHPKATGGVLVELVEPEVRTLERSESSD
jgi:methylmalonyl-CoA/ethylmalonyl-CoA epimerase